MYAYEIIMLRPYISHRKFMKLNFFRKIRSYVAQETWNTKEGKCIAGCS